MIIKKVPAIPALFAGALLGGIAALVFQPDIINQNGIKNTVIRSGIGLGSVLAVVLSWERNKSVLLAFLHGIFGGLYVLYFVITRKPEERH